MPKTYGIRLLYSDLVRVDWQQMKKTVEKDGLYKALPIGKYPGWSTKGLGGPVTN